MVKPSLSKKKKKGREEEGDQANYADALVHGRRGLAPEPGVGQPDLERVPLHLVARVHHPAEVRHGVLQPGEPAAALGLRHLDLDQRLRPADPLQPVLGLAVAVGDHRQQPEHAGHAAGEHHDRHQVFGRQEREQVHGFSRVRQVRVWVRV